ncbi:unnamed protein product [Adineta steineri]|uniref:Uncharacterized protein n=1 Tax=Adineta steineri TaxID=433720 RepID=A0A814S211_9BILA|nr:unnamed protein product [Adineta steineri]
MTDSNSFVSDVKPVITPQIPVPQSSFLTIPYNPAAHPRQISLLDINGQPIQYTLIPSNQNTPHMEVNHMAPDGNACSICGSVAAAKCWYGMTSGRPCNRLLCLTHVMELPSAHGGRYPHCPEHYQFIQQNKCSIQ